MRKLKALGCACTFYIGFMVVVALACLFAKKCPLAFSLLFSYASFLTIGCPVTIKIYNKMIDKDESEDSENAEH